MNLPSRAWYLAVQPQQGPSTVNIGLLQSLQPALGEQYRVERELGRGGMGVVYLARDLTLDRPVAVKIVHPDLSTNRAVAARFLAEARTIAKLRHPNIVSVHAAGEVAGQLYYVMDYLPGETLRQRLTRDGRLEPAVAARIASDIADALDTASAAGVVHRDLKPENILLDGTPDEPRALLTDFGIAWLAEGGEGHTGPGAVMGTPAYMSPEQAAGEELDGRSDLYSLGIVTYEMITGAPPFTGTHRAVISKQILDRPAPIDQARPGIAPALAGAVMRALEKIPDARWASGKAFRRAMTGEISPPSGATAVPRRSIRRPITMAAAVSLIALFAVFGPRLRRDGPPQGVNPRHSILVLPFRNARGDPGYGWLGDGSVSMLSLALSQWHDLTVVDQDRVHDLVGSEGQPNRTIGLELARAMARESRVWTVVLGDFERVGDTLRLVARMYDVASGKQVEAVQVADRAGDDVRPLFDQLAAKLLDLTGAPQTNRASLASVTTQSVEAYRAYLRGVDDLNHWRLAEASQELERAVRIDSTFSLANYRLAIARGWLSAVDTIGLAAIRRAARSAERLPARERQLIEGYRTFVEGDFERGMTLYSQLIARDSADVEAWYGLADAAFHGGYAHGRVEMLGKSLKGFRRVIGLDSTFGLAYEHIGALLTDVSQPHGWLRLVGTDSIIGWRPALDDSAMVEVERRQANQQAVALAQAWTRLQPSTSRAQYHLYKAYLAGNRVSEARQTVARLRAMHSDSNQAVFSLLDARAQFVGGDIGGAAQTVRTALPKVVPHSFGELDFAPEPVIDIMTGASAVGYLGDLATAAQLIRLGHELRRAHLEARDSTEKAREDDLWEIARLGSLYAASGTRTDRLRSLWTRGVALAKASEAEHRAMSWSYLTPTAIGLLLGPSGDPSAVTELEQLTEQPSPRSVRALMLARRGDSTGARALLADSTATKSMSGKSFQWSFDGSDLVPVIAQAYFELGDFAKVVEVLRGFQKKEFFRRGFDARWIVLPRIRLLRGQALERLGRNTLATAEFQAVIDQWTGADAELGPVVQQARQHLARLAGNPEAH